MSDHGASPGGVPNTEEPKAEHLNIKVTDNNNEVFFKIKRTTQLSKLMNAFCDRQGKSLQTVRFLFDGTRVNATDTPDTVREIRPLDLFNLADQDSNSLIWLMEIRSRYIKSRLAVLDSSTKSIAASSGCPYIYG